MKKGKRNRLAEEEGGRALAFRCIKGGVKEPKKAAPHRDGNRTFTAKKGIRRGDVVRILRLT